MAQIILTLEEWQDIQERLDSLEAKVFADDSEELDIKDDDLIDSDNDSLL